MAYMYKSLCPGKCNFSGGVLTNFTCLLDVCDASNTEQSLS